MTTIKSEVSLVSELLCMGRFQVPWHQRRYDWNVEQVNDLLTDLKDAIDNGQTCYFLGSVMFVESDSPNTWQVNDGQQRMITLSILIGVLCRHFVSRRSRDPSRESLALRMLFKRQENEISRLDDASHYEQRITPPRHDKSRYLQIIRGQDIGTNGKLTSAWREITTFVSAMNRASARKFFDFLMKQVEISVLMVPRNVDASAVFEALNGRGKTLDDIDLIRNYFYSHFSDPKEINRRQTVHENLEQTLVISGSARNSQEYFRCYLQCELGFIQKTRFYRETRMAISAATRRKKSSDYIFGLIERLSKQDSVELFRTITSPSPNAVLLKKIAATRSKRNLATILRELRGYRVSHPIIFALLHRFVNETNQRKKAQIKNVVIRSLKNLTSFVMRTAFVASKFEPSRFEVAFANCAMDIFTDTQLSSLDISSYLENNDEYNVIDNANFIRHMTNAEFRDSKKARRYLYGINERAQIGSDILREDRCTVEHILPKSAKHWEGWCGFAETQPEEWVHRPGNLVILSSRENRPGSVHNQSYDAKKEIFSQSALHMPREVVDLYAEWTPEVIEARSRKLAKEAALTWRFDHG